ncbi:Embryonic stem cell-specific 5-hydroxymethylcytosine-binding protein [Armadillidium nasatum]|uniref:Abasic site processing protein HMCES n=1 Tax=Armadillidium nasatum TaxID=96803 RepID=A0A5N5SN70_9CRUS|nr:Embryonic stem cell-specific 5-hydroxymethylcytosine-binding protein [Armadillidium nasatum]
MCGRTVFTLAPDEVCQACSVLSTNNKGQKQYVSPQWKDHPGKYTYSPSTNIAPSAFTPILFRFSDSSSKKRDVEGNDKKENEKLLVQPMMWGMIPHFYRGETPYRHGYKTNNCRIEDIEEKKIFKALLYN